MGKLTSEKLNATFKKPVFGRRVVTIYYRQHTRSINISDLLRITFDFDVYLETKGCNLQRELVWSDEQKSECILSILKGSNIGIFAAFIDASVGFGRGADIWRIIDGKQRINTILQFLKNECFVSLNGEKYYYRDLEEKLARSFDRTIVFFSLIESEQADLKRAFIEEANTERSETAIKLHQSMIKDHEVSDEALIRWFLLINFSGVPQQNEHLTRLSNLLTNQHHV